MKNKPFCILALLGILVGCGGESPATRTPDTLESWARLAWPTGIEGRYYHTAVKAGSKMYVWGGQLGLDGADTHSLGDGAFYDTSTSSWTTIPESVSIRKRQQHSAVVVGLSKMIVWGGHRVREGAVEADDYDNGAVFDLTENSWTPITTPEGHDSDAPEITPPSPRYNHAAFWTTSNKMLIWGGTTSVGPFMNQPLTDGKFYVPDTTYAQGTWESMADFTTSGVDSRLDPSMTWTGAKLVVWGGSNSYPIDTGAVYNPVENTWTPMSQTHAPGPRVEHAAVAIGNKIYIWGGYGCEPEDAGQVREGDGAPIYPLTPGSETERYCALPHVLNSGAVYDVTTDTWTSLTTTDAPTARNNHRAVSTGSQIIIWGGEGTGSTGLTAGAIYTPSNSTWTAMATSTSDLLNAVAGRNNHSAVWMSSSMIVCGGTDVTVVEDCGIYTPYQAGQEIPVLRLPDLEELGF